MFVLNYADGRNNVSLSLQVNGSYQVVIPTFGVVDGKGKSFNEFARDIEKLVLNYNAFALPRVNLVATGSFYVTVKGEVSSTRSVSAWGLTNLSSVVTSATDKASSRLVQIESADKSIKTYDLYRALKEGDLSQNPYVKAGDIITLLKADKIVTIAGEVNRRGVYQPLKGETLATILQRYAQDILPSGDKEAVLVRRYNAKTEGNIDILRVEKDQFATFAVEHMDTIYVNAVMPLSRAVTIEGAVNMGSETVRSSALSSSGKLYYQFFPGETVAEMLQNISHRFSAVSDLGATYLLKGNQLITVDVQAILLGEEVENAKLPLNEGDRFVVPFNQLFVNVTGGVMNPVTFPYIPDKKASYYINLAGGFDPAKNKKSAYTIIDKYGNKVANDETVPPEAVVTAKLNTFQAVNALNLATTVTIVGLVAAILSIILDVSKISQL